MRYLLDTNIFLFSALDPDNLSSDVKSILDDYDNTFCMSAESVKELIVAFNNGKVVAKHWKTAKDMVNSIREKYFIRILPIGEEHLETYARLEVNEAQNHKDPSDHMIIAHAITERLPLLSSDEKFPFYRAQGLDLIEY